MIEAIFHTHAGPNPCTPNPCQNNGECVEEIGNYSCLCREDGSVVYSGRNCTIGMYMYVIEYNTDEKL